MELTIISPAKIVCKEEAEKVFLPGTEGDFTVLKNHAPLIATLGKGKVRYGTGSHIKEIEIEGGIAEVKDNFVKVIVEQ